MSNNKLSTPPTPPTGGTTPGTDGKTTGERTNNNPQGATGTRNRSQGNNSGTIFRISNFKGEVSEVRAVIGTKSKDRMKDSMTLF